MKIDIFCTLGPPSLNKKFLKFSRGKINLFRINMSHVTIANLQNQINFIKKIPIYQFVLIPKEHRLELK